MKITPKMKNRIVLGVALVVGIAIVIITSSILKANRVELGMKAVNGGSVLTAVLVAIGYITLYFWHTQKCEEEERLGDLRGIDDWIVEYIKKHRYSMVFGKSVTNVERHIKDFNKKKNSIMVALGTRFHASGILTSTILKVVGDTEDLLNRNIKSLFSRIDQFDEEEYVNIVQNRIDMPAEIRWEKIKIYEQYIEYIKGAIVDNEEIILKFDKLLFEISKLDSFREGELEQTESYKELDRVIMNAAKDKE